MSVNNSALVSMACPVVQMMTGGGGGRHALCWASLASIIFFKMSYSQC